MLEAAPRRSACLVAALPFLVDRNSRMHGLRIVDTPDRAMHGVPWARLSRECRAAVLRRAVRADAVHHVRAALVHAEKEEMEDEETLIETAMWMGADRVAAVLRGRRRPPPPLPSPFHSDDMDEEKEKDTAVSFQDVVVGDMLLLPIANVPCAVRVDHVTRTRPGKVGLPKTRLVGTALLSGKRTETMHRSREVAQRADTGAIEQGTAVWMHDDETVDVMLADGGMRERVLVQRALRDVLRAEVERADGDGVAVDVVSVEGVPLVARL